jgi:hypothetical protein
VICIPLCGSSESSTLRAPFVLFTRQRPGSLWQSECYVLLRLIMRYQRLVTFGLDPQHFKFFKKYKVRSLTQTLATAQQAAPCARDVPVVGLTWPLNQVHVSDAKQRRRLEIAASSFCVSLDDACQPGLGCFFSSTCHDLDAGSFSIRSTKSERRRTKKAKHKEHDSDVEETSSLLHAPHLNISL